MHFKFLSSLRYRDEMRKMKSRTKIEVQRWQPEQDEHGNGNTCMDRF